MKRYILLYAMMLMIGCSESRIDTLADQEENQYGKISVMLQVAESDDSLTSRVSITPDSDFDNPWIVEWEAYDDVLIVGKSSTTSLDTSSILTMTTFDKDASTFSGEFDGDMTSARLFYPTRYCSFESGDVTISYENVLSGCRYPAMVSDGAITSDEISMVHIGGAIDLQFSFTGLLESQSYQLIKITLSSGSATLYNRATLDYDFTSGLTTSDMRMSKGSINVSVDMNVENSVDYSVIFNTLPFEVADDTYITLEATLLGSDGKLYSPTFEKRNSTGSSVSFPRGSHNYLSNVLFDMSSESGSTESWIDNMSIFADSSSGTSTDPIEISSAKELAYLSYLTTLSSYDTKDKYYKLTADIDLGGKLWIPIGSNTSTFNGNFDGNGHSIYNLTIDQSSKYQGLFGYVISSGSSTISIQGVHIASGHITYSSEGQYIGGVVGYGESVDISDCSNNASIGGTSHIGGIAGFIYSGSSITRCSNSGSIYAGDQKIGGIVGYSDNTSISECSNRGTILCITNYHAGGIVGCLGSSINTGNTIQDCYNMGDITAPSSVGGITGRTYSMCDVSYCYNTGSVTSTNSSNMGSIVGNNVGSVTNCFSTVLTTSGNGVSGTSKSDSELKSTEMLDTLNNGGSTWSQLSGNYPILSWE